MDFRTVKEFCKHAAPATKCPATFKDCNADNCPLAIQSSMIDGDARGAKQEFLRTQESLKNLLDQYDEVKSELEESINKSLGLVYTTLCDLKDKIKITLKRLEP